MFFIIQFNILQPCPLRAIEPSTLCRRKGGAPDKMQNVAEKPKRGRSAKKESLLSS
jgi:hypothetical protein